MDMTFSPDDSNKNGKSANHVATVLSTIICRQISNYPKLSQCLFYENQ
ncbi:MAG: hypothetical protein LBU34_11550 [Planctomycetaceae bacterium]|nr:hypothetical protein [Planctomycetaceae bacterium]